MAPILGLVGCGDDVLAPAPDDALDLSAAWRTAAPSDVGLDEQTLVRAQEEGALIPRLRGLVVVRHGKLAFEQYYGGWTQDTLADVRSVTKSIVSTLAGIALERGELASLDDPITRYVRAPEYRVRPVHDSITVRHLLTMTGGFAWDEGAGDRVTPYSIWIQSEDHVGYLLDKEVVDPPGSTFIYNSAAVHLLGVLLEEATGKTLPAYADEVLFGPLGIRERVWESFADGHVNAGAGLDLRLRDLARFGQLYLQEGWSGRTPVVPSIWVGEATTRRFSWTLEEGSAARVSYGYLWWLDLDRGAWFAWGYGGQYVYVAPALDLVVVAATQWRGALDDGTYLETEAAVLSLIIDYVVAAAR